MLQFVLNTPIWCRLGIFLDGLLMQSLSINYNTGSECYGLLVVRSILLIKLVMRGNVGERW